MLKARFFQSVHSNILAATCRQKTNRHMAIIVKCAPSNISRSGERTANVRINSAQRGGPGEGIFVWTFETKGGCGLHMRGTVQAVDFSGGFTTLSILVSEEKPLRPLKNSMLAPHKNSSEEGPLQTLADKLLGYSLRGIRNLDAGEERYLDSFFLPTSRSHQSAHNADDRSLDRDIDDGVSHEIDRQRRQGARATRPQQAAFSRKLRRNYQNRCAVTGCVTSAALQAAHIRIRPDQDDNRSENGILLRSDIHALFDTYLITLSEDGTRLEVSPELADPGYAFLRTVIVRAPVKGPRPSSENISDHRCRFRKRQQSQSNNARRRSGTK